MGEGGAAPEIPTALFRANRKIVKIARQLSDCFVVCEINFIVTSMALYIFEDPFFFFCFRRYDVTNKFKRESGGKRHVRRIDEKII